MLKSKVRELCGIDKDVRLFIHNLVDNENEIDTLAKGMGYGYKKRENDDVAKVLAEAKTCIAYRLDNVIYIIPAKRVEMPLSVTLNDGDEKPNVHVVYEYPCEMRVKDLVEY